MLLRYDTWLKEQAKYTDCTCGVADCNKPGLYEGGDARCWFPACEEHASMREKYLFYLNLRNTDTRDVDIAYRQKLERQMNIEKQIQEALNGTNGTRAKSSRKNNENYTKV